MTANEQRTCMKIYAQYGPKLAAELFDASMGAVYHMAKRYGVKAAKGSKKRNQNKSDKILSDIEDRKNIIRDLDEQDKPKKREIRRYDPCQGCYMVMDAGRGVGTSLCISHCLKEIQKK